MTVTLISHPGKRAIDAFEQDFPVRPASDVHPLIDSVKEDGRRHSFVQVDDEVYRGGRFEDVLGDVEVSRGEDGIRVLFDGDLSGFDNGSCVGPTFVVTEDGIYTRVCFADGIVIVAEEGRDGPYLVPIFSGDRIRDPRRRQILDLGNPEVSAREDVRKRFVIHDRKIVDLADFVARNITATRGRLESQIGRMREELDALERKLQDGSTPTYPPERMRSDFELLQDYRQFLYAGTL